MHSDLAQSVTPLEIKNLRLSLEVQAWPCSPFFNFSKTFFLHSFGPGTSVNFSLSFVFLCARLKRQVILWEHPRRVGGSVGGITQML